MKNNLNTKSKIAALCCVALSSSASAASLAFVPDIPTDDLLVGTTMGEGPQGTASGQATFGFRNGDADGTEGTRARGQSFTFATGSGDTYDISSLSVSLNTPGDDNGFRPDGQLFLTVFQWDSADPDDFTAWDAGTGGEFAAGHVEAFSGSFPILSTDSWTNADLLEISFDAGDLSLSDGTSYGFLFNYTLDSLLDGSDAPLNEDVNINFDARQNNGIAGALLSTNPNANFADADNAQSDSRDLNFFITGTASIPEPSSMTLLALGGLAFARRRR